MNSSPDQIKRFRTFASSQAKLVLFTTILISGLSFFAITAVNIAIPSIQRAFDSTVADVQWVVNSYSLMLGMLILLSGSLADRIGRKKMMLLGMSLFMIGGLLCGLAHEIDWLITFRALQGIGAALMIPQSLAIINASFDERIRGQAIGLWGGISGSMTIFGPFLSGLLIDILSWRYVFFVLVPFCLVAIWFIWRYIDEQVPRGKKNIDYIGAILVSSAMLSLSYALIEASERGWQHPLIIGTLVGGLIVLIIFAWYQVRRKEPLIAVEIFHRRHVILANLYTLLMYTLLGSVVFFLVLFLQQIQELTASESGLALLPLSMTITLLTLVAGRIVDAFGSRLPLVVGSIFVAGGLLIQFFITQDAPYWAVILPSLLLIGVGFGLFIPGLTKTALAVSEEHSGAASGVNNSVSRIAGLIGVAFFASLITPIYAEGLHDNLKKESVPPVVIEEIVKQAPQLLAIDTPVIKGMHPEALQEAVRLAKTDAFLVAYRIMMLLGSLIAVLGGVIAMALKPEDQWKG